MNYDIYIFSREEKLIYSSLGALIALLISWSFYKNMIMFFVLLIPCEIFFLGFVKKDLIKRRKDELSLEFREALMAVQSSLNAGYSVENAFIEAGLVMEHMYGDSIITKEFKVLTRRLRSNEVLEKILMELSDRSGNEDIQDFANVFATAKRSGGDFTRIIRKATDSIGDKMDVYRDIKTSISSKKYENRIMEAVPFGILVYLNVTSPNFLNPLYNNVKGFIVMTVCLAIYLAAFMLAEKISADVEKM